MQLILLKLGNRDRPVFGDGNERINPAAGALQHAARIDGLLRLTVDELVSVIADLKKIVIGESDTAALPASADPAKVAELLAKLKSRLEDNDAEAADVLEALIPLVKGTPRVQPLRNIAREIDSYNFDAALAVMPHGMMVQ